MCTALCSFSLFWFFRWISRICCNPSWVCQALHHLSGTSEISSYPRSKPRWSGTCWSAQFRGRTRGEHIWQKRWLRQTITVTFIWLHWKEKWIQGCCSLVSIFKSLQQKWSYMVKRLHFYSFRKLWFSILVPYRWKATYPQIFSVSVFLCMLCYDTKHRWGAS